MQCTTCNGIGFVLVERQQYVSRRIHRTASGRNCWPHESSISAIERFPTGRYHKINELCDDCHGSGRGLDPDFDPDCRQCQGTGTATVADGYGGTDYDECACKRVALEVS